MPKPKHRLIETASFEGDLGQSGVIDRTIYEGETPLAQTEVAEIALRARGEAQLFTYLGFRAYEPFEVRVQTLRTGRLADFLGKIGLHNLVSYETTRRITHRDLEKPRTPAL